MKILGISAHYHDAAAALLVDGLPVASVQEERLSRRKNDAAFPMGAIEWCLEQGGLEPDDLDAVGLLEVDHSQWLAVFLPVKYCSDEIDHRPA